MKRLQLFLETIVTTGLGTGFAPIAPATFGSALACVVLWFLPGVRFWPSLLLVVPFFFLGVWLATRGERRYGHDGKPIVIDELTGQWISLLFAQQSLKIFLAAFLLFRLFDIWKPLGIRQSQKLPVGWGVMIDDVLAGALSLLCLHLLTLLPFFS
ncbi:MAG: phosphatidylglycerophosphatase A [bacterium]